MLYLAASNRLPRRFKPRHPAPLPRRLLKATCRAVWWTILFARRAYIALSAWDLNRYIRECDEDGILDTASLREFNAQLDELRAKLILLRAGVWA